MPPVEVSVTRATVVLVHGAWHGSWCWEEVRPLLDAVGLESRVVDLPSTLEAGGDFHADVAAVTACLDACPGPVLLVGHSYGGAVVTEAGTHPNVRSLVFLAGSNLTEDESASAAAVEEASDVDHGGRPQLDLVDVGDGRGAATPVSARAVFFGDCSPDVASKAVRRLRPQQLSCLAASPGAVAWRTKPSTYVVCERDNAVHPDLQRILARRATRVAALPSSHSPFLSMPARVAELVAEAADAEHCG